MPEAQRSQVLEFVTQTGLFTLWSQAQHTGSEFYLVAKSWRYYHLPFSLGFCHFAQITSCSPDILGHFLFRMLGYMQCYPPILGHLISLIFNKKSVTSEKSKTRSITDIGTHTLDPQYTWVQQHAEMMIENNH